MNNIDKLRTAQDLINEVIVKPEPRDFLVIEELREVNSKLRDNIIRSLGSIAYFMEY